MKINEFFSYILKGIAFSIGFSIVLFTAEHIRMLHEEQKLQKSIETSNYKIIDNDSLEVVEHRHIKHTKIIRVLVKVKNLQDFTIEQAKVKVDIFDDEGKIDFCNNTIGDIKPFAEEEVMVNCYNMYNDELPPKYELIPTIEEVQVKK